MWQLFKLNIKPLWEFLVTGRTSTFMLIKTCFAMIQNVNVRSFLQWAFINHKTSFLLRSVKTQRRKLPLLVFWSTTKGTLMIVRVILLKDNTAHILSKTPYDQKGKTKFRLAFGLNLCHFLFPLWFKDVFFKRVSVRLFFIILVVILTLKTGLKLFISTRVHLNVRDRVI